MYYTRIKIENLAKLLLFFLLAISFIAIISTSYAADKTISPTTPGGLKTAIETAKSGDTIYMENGVYNGENNRGLIITKSINIQGKGKNVVIDAQGKDRVFALAFRSRHLLPLYSVTLKNLIIKNGYVIGHIGDGCGGAIYVDSILSHKLNVISCTFINNSVASKKNPFGQGGAISQADYNGVTKIISVFNSTFKDNKANREGGAIHNVNSVSGCTFINNQNGWGGGAIYQANSVSKCTFKNNQALSGGAILYSQSVKNCDFINNKATNGGAIFSVPSVSKCTFKNNQAKKIGGAIYDPLKISSCTFKGNTANSGAAVYCCNANVTISKSMFKDNKAKKVAGAVYIDSIYKIVKITNSKFEKNVAGKKYNAIYKGKYAMFSLKNVKITPKDGTKVKK